MGEKRDAYRDLVGRPEGKRQLVRPMRRWEDNIKIVVWGDTGLLICFRIGTRGWLL
jgi:hypothetical protein